MQAKTGPSRTSLSIAACERPRDSEFQTLSLVWVAGITLLLVPMVTLIDVTIARAFANHPLHSEIISVLDLARVLSHGGGVFIVLVAVILMAPEKRWFVPRLAALAMGGGAVATLAKMFVLRPRPNGLNLQRGTLDSAWLWAFDWDWDHVATFDAGTRAFPSGSIATAIAFTVGLWVVLPRGRWLFAAMCCGAFLQRLHSGSHFLSDLIGGAAFGLLWAYVCFHPWLLGRVFDEMEPRKSQRQSAPERSQEELEVQLPNADSDHRIAA